MRACCRYGTDSEDINLGRWVKHAEDKHNIKVQCIVADENLTEDLTYLPPLPVHTEPRSCPSSVMPGIGLGSVSTNLPQQNVTTWEECRDLCCAKDDMCVSWTLSLAEKTCFLRKQLGHIVKQDKNLISGITKSHVLSAPHPNKEVRFYVGILSAPNNDVKVHIVAPLMLRVCLNFEAWSVGKCRVTNV